MSGARLIVWKNQLLAICVPELASDRALTKQEEFLIGLYDENADLRRQLAEAKEIKLRMGDIIADGYDRSERAEATITRLRAQLHRQVATAKEQTEIMDRTCRKVHHDDKATLLAMTDRAEKAEGELAELGRQLAAKEGETWGAAIAVCERLARQEENLLDGSDGAAGSIECLCAFRKAAGDLREAAEAAKEKQA